MMEEEKQDCFEIKKESLENQNYLYQFTAKNFGLDSLDVDELNKKEVENIN